MPVLLFGFHGDSNRPNEAEELAPHCGHDLLQAFAPTEQCAVATMESVPSPVGAGGRVYIPGRDGITLVVRHGGKFEVLAKNTLDDGFDASPALVDSEIYLRGYKYLYDIAAR